MRRIARHSQGESRLEDVQGEIWIVADELSKKRGSPIDLINPEHQDLLIAHTYQKLVRYCETNVRYAARLDSDSLGGAWLSVLETCNNKMTSVAYFLKISLGHSYRRFNQALHITAEQSPLPLYLPDDIPLNPRPWRRYRLYRKPEQLTFVFDEELPFQ